MVVKMSVPVDFEAEDRQPVDLVCLLLVSEGSDSTKLHALALVAKALRTTEIVGRLRSAESAAELLRVLDRAKVSDEMPRGAGTAHPISSPARQF
jgi:PTS system nitrogen regulatory IIA component